MTGRRELRRMLKGMAAIWAALTLSISLPSCNGIFAGIYDTDDGDNTTKVSDNSFANIDVTSYTQWTYLNFHDRSLVTGEIDDEGNYTDPSEDWDIALHRWDTRTNGGAALETEYRSIDALIASGTMPSGEWVEDIWTTEQVIIDMTGMMSGVLGYTEAWYNPELSKWIDVDLGQMPPLYNLSGKVYLVQFADGTLLAAQLSDYTDAVGNKGYLTIEYIYPFEF